MNAAVRGSSGAIWFSQSAHNTEEQGELGMFTPVDLPLAEGALWRLPFHDGQFAADAELVVDDRYYANGIAIDEERGRLYLCEVTADRVLSFPLDVSTGELGERSTLLEAMTPDNPEVDADGRLWVALPGRNEILVVEPDTGAVHSVFHQQSPAQVELADEFVRRGDAATPRLELLTPVLYEPLPGFVTGVILGATDGAVYVTGFGDGLLRLDPATAE